MRARATVLKHGEKYYTCQCRGCKCIMQFSKLEADLDYRRNESYIPCPECGETVYSNSDSVQYQVQNTEID